MHPPGLASHVEKQSLSQEQLPDTDLNSPPPSPMGSQSHILFDFFDFIRFQEFHVALTFPVGSTIDIEAQTHAPVKASGSWSLSFAFNAFAFRDLAKGHFRAVSVGFIVPPLLLVVHVFSIFSSFGKDGIQARRFNVAFKDLRVVAIGDRASFQPTVSSILSPVAIMKSIRTMRHPPVRDILSGFEGVVTPGEMLLVLGRPGSGCSTFLRTVANQRRDCHAVHGDVHYDYFTPEDITERYHGDVMYCPEDDVHFPTLAVEQTLSFAAIMRTPQKRLANQSREEYRKLVVEVLMRVFGLGHARNMVVGNAAIKGISGGEKKRVSIAEALSCRSRIHVWDNSTRGLYASTALEFVRALRIATDIVRVTTIVSLYQAGEQLYNHFDKLCVINEGKMAYFGPAKDASPKVTDPSGRKIRPGYPGTVPLTANDKASYFKNSRLGQLSRSSLDSYLGPYVNRPAFKKAYTVSAVSEHARYTSESHAYALSAPMQVHAVMRQLWHRLHLCVGRLAFHPITTEFNTSSTFDTSVTIFKQASGAEIIAESTWELVDAEEVAGEAYCSRDAGIFQMLIESISLRQN
ncbi:hypothetical protein PAXINDRAFT_102018 [Paxillus involutus ATCC 200175]|uniref:ABC transporter domain-containing protein n=1 Tax=Paxillus involutus ATCC 200175 TaxID=664439 RepID=A0A0C9SRG6_PAXIN|nr:hypothetical protein PAXINDRAFT_102018 [Paxillus involutus ATCC 200175]